MKHVVSYYVGYFLRIFSVLLLLPVFVGKFYGESFVGMESYIIASFISIVFGSLLVWIGDKERPDAIEGMMAAMVGWILAVTIGALPFVDLIGMSMVDAFFESMNGFSTTGMSLVTDIGALPRSLIFWRGFIQWIGGLGILSFFAVVVAEAGGAVQSLVSAEANKSDSGKIRPSIYNAVRSLWFVYLAFTALEMFALYMTGMHPFDGMMYALSTMPTGGFSHTVGGLAAYDGWGVQAVMIVFMLAGGTNFLLLYRVLQGDVMSLFQDEEFRLYLGIIGASFIFVSADLVLSAGQEVAGALGDALFTVVSVTSSTGFEIVPLRSFSEVSRMLFIVLMFVGGCLGSTTGGIKMFRLDILIKVVRREVRSFSMPKHALNLIRAKGERVKTSQITRIVAIFVTWLLVMILGGLITVALSPLSIIQSFQAIVSSMGTMGPLYISPEMLASLSPTVKLVWSLAMLAGRLEMLPLLVLLNVEIVRRLH